jgi:hypothetical protein
MQRETYRIETKLINDFPASYPSAGFHGHKVKEVKNVIEFRKLFDGFKRAMKFGSSMSPVRWETAKTHV